MRPPQERCNFHNAHNDSTVFNFKYYLKDNWEAFHRCSCKCFQRKSSHLLEDKMRGKHLSLIREQYVITWNTECSKKVLKWRTYFSSFKWNASYLAHKLNIFIFLWLQTDTATESLSWAFDSTERCTVGFFVLEPWYFWLESPQTIGFSRSIGWKKAIIRTSIHSQIDQFL